MSRAALLRFMPSALGLLAYVLIGLLYIFNTPFYYAVLSFWGIARFRPNRQIRVLAALAKTPLSG